MRTASGGGYCGGVGGSGGALADLAEHGGLSDTAHFPPSELRYPINVSDLTFRAAARWEPTRSLRETVARSEDVHR